MRKYTVTIATTILLITLANTNPEKLSAQGLILTLVFASAVTVFIVRTCWYALLFRLGKIGVKDDHQEQVIDLRSLSLAVLAIVFLSFLNLVGSLSLRDFVLAILLSFLCHFYIERRKQRA